MWQCKFKEKKQIENAYKILETEIQGNHFEKLNTNEMYWKRLIKN